MLSFTRSECTCDAQKARVLLTSRHDQNARSTRENQITSVIEVGLHLCPGGARSISVSHKRFELETTLLRRSVNYAPPPLLSFSLWRSINIHREPRAYRTGYVYRTCVARQCSFTAVFPPTVEVGMMLMCAVPTTQTGTRSSEVDEMTSCRSDT